MYRFFLLLSLVVCCAETNDAAEPDPPLIGCRQGSTIRVRIRVSEPAGAYQALTTDIRLVVDRVWQAYGVIPEWAESDSARALHEVDVAMLAREERIADYPAALGGVTFSRDGRTQLARLSLGAALELVQSNMPLYQRVRGPLRGVLTLSVGRSGAQAARLVGYAAAHELGHLLLGSKSHSPSGLMVARYQPFQWIGNPGKRLLDAVSQKRLLERLEGVPALY